MKTNPWRLRLTNTIGTLGYISVLLQWAWAAIILCYPLITADHTILFPTNTPQAPATQMEFGAMSPMLLIVAAIFTLLVLALSVIALIQLPKNIGKAGTKTTHAVAKVVLPTVTHHKELSKKRYFTLSYRIVFGIKYLMTVLPFVLLIFAPSIIGLSAKIITTVGALVLTFSLVYFSVQLLLAEVLRVDKKKVW